MSGQRPAARGTSKRTADEHAVSFQLLGPSFPYFGVWQTLMLEKKEKPNDHVGKCRQIGRSHSNFATFRLGLAPT